MANGTIKKKTQIGNPTLFTFNVNNPFTPNCDGFLTVRAEWDTQNVDGYVYIRDTTTDFYAAMLSFRGTNGTQSSLTFPVIAGHTYTIPTSSHVASFYAFYSTLS